MIGICVVLTKVAMERGSDCGEREICVWEGTRERGMRDGGRGMGMREWDVGWGMWDGGRKTSM
jgi:hypothetical protein